MRIFKPDQLGVGARIAATGSYLPERAVTNAELVAKGGPLTEEEIVKLCGVQTRHHASANQAASDLALKACQRALASGQVAASALDRLVLATVSGDHSSPATACIVQHALGAPTIPAYDLTASCSGFVFALDAAVRAVCTGDQHVLAVASEVRSRFLDPLDRATFALFGDGAAAALVTPAKPGHGILAIGLATDGSGAKSVYVPAGGSREPASAETVAGRRHFIRMEDGPQVYLSAVEGMLATAEALLSSCQITWDNIRWVVPHQPNRRILERMAKLGRIPLEKVFIQVEHTGNVAGASVGLALDETLRTAQVSPGDKILLLAAGAGYTAGAALVEVDEELMKAATFSP
jgi:3-oxoacyl-[acyl-carrier-protein] synthase III